MAAPTGSSAGSLFSVVPFSAKNEGAARVLQPCRAVTRALPSAALELVDGTYCCSTGLSPPVSWLLGGDTRNISATQPSAPRAASSSCGWTTSQTQAIGSWLEMKFRAGLPSPHSVMELCESSETTRAGTWSHTLQGTHLYSSSCSPKCPLPSCPSSAMAGVRKGTSSRWGQSCR